MGSERFGILHNDDRESHRGNPLGDSESEQDNVMTLAVDGERSPDSCPCGCPTYGAHLRAKGIRVAYTDTANGWDLTKQKRWDRELSRYRDLRGQGIEPRGTTHRDMDQAEKVLNS